MKNLAIFFLIFIFPNLAQAQIKNRVYGEVFFMRVGQDVKGGTSNYNEETNLNFFPGFELGYAISNSWLTNLRLRKKSHLGIDGGDFGHLETQRIEMSIGLEYIRKYRKRYHWSYGVGAFYESIKSRVSNCFGQNGNEGFKNKRNVKGISFELSLNYKIKPDIWFVVATRYRVGNTWIPNHQDLSPFYFSCVDRDNGVDIFEMISKLGIRFFL